MFESRHKPGYAQVQIQDKLVPYTITPIGGLNELKVWKLQQELKEQKHQAELSLKKDAVVEGILDGSLAKKEFAESAATQAHKKYQQQQKEMLEKYQAKISEKNVTTEKQSLFSQFKSWLLGSQRN